MPPPPVPPPKLNTDLTQIGATGNGANGKKRKRPEEGEGVIDLASSEVDDDSDDEPVVVKETKWKGKKTVVPIGGLKKRSAEVGAKSKVKPASKEKGKGKAKLVLDDEDEDDRVQGELPLSNSQHRS
jgi:hypothetical protein